MSAAALACYGGALLATLALAAWTTPRSWWRRPNARALAVLVLGTGTLGTVLWWMAAPQAVGERALAHSLAAEMGAEMETAPTAVLQAGRSYRVADALNLRAAGGVHASRVVVLAPGAIVTATGRREGDWWQVAARVDGMPVEGWASSLWLRRAEERQH